AKVAQRINSSNSTTVVRGPPQLPSSSALYLANKCSRSQDRHKEDEEHYRCWSRFAIQNVVQFQFPSQEGLLNHTAKQRASSPTGKNPAEKSLVKSNII
ncbi:hypothetical protein D5086_024743, partial [Populus alba]